jgi:two-component system OmpR family sensor kinase
LTRIPIRARLTAAFALAMALVLVAAGLFVFLHVRGDLDEAIDDALEARAQAVASTGDATAGAPGDPEEAFAQLQAPDGRVLDSAGDAGAVPAREGDRRMAGIEGRARVLVHRDGDRVVVVGQSLADRAETLSSLAAAFAVGAPAAVLVASLLGYVLAASALRPIEAMRRRAAGVSLEGPDELPLPAARDEVRRLGETLNAMLGRLRRSYAREHRFVADASHELRTPLAVMRAELETAIRRAGDDPELRAGLIAALEECDHMTQLAEDLLTVARAGEGGLVVRPETLAASQLLEGTRARFADRAAEHGRAIAVDVPAGLAVHGDETRLRQALGNLVDNALRHGEGAIALRARADGEGVELEVADEGPGFPPDLAERAFDRFVRGDEARTGDGTGLGLAIVQAIAEAHGGRARVAGGATVRLELPPKEPPSHGP